MKRWQNSFLKTIIWVIESKRTAFSIGNLMTKKVNIAPQI